MGILDFLAGPVKGVIEGVRGIIDDTTTTKEEKLAAQRALVKLQQDFQSEILEAEAKIMESRADVLKTEIASEHWLAANWRPILMLVFTYIIAHNFVVSPLFGVPSVDIPTDMWDLLKLGMTGYIGFRSAEKMLPHTKWSK